MDEFENIIEGIDNDPDVKDFAATICTHDGSTFTVEPNQWAAVTDGIFLTEARLVDGSVVRNISIPRTGIAWVAGSQEEDD